MDKEKLGLVLDGGGARGAYQIGALRAMKEKGYQFDGVVGTSIGALNGAMLCQDELSLAQSLWEKLDYKNVFAYEDELYESYEALLRLDVKSVDFLKLANSVVRIIKDGGLDNEPMKAMIHKHLDEGLIRKCGCDFGLVTVNVTDMKAEELFIEDIPEGKLEDYILASAYVPVFKKRTFNGKNFLDGGFYDNSPVNMLLERGYKKIVVIKLGGLLGIQRSYEASDANIFFIEPRESLGDLLEFDVKRIRYNIQLGYFDALKRLDDLAGTKYYIKQLPKEQYFIEQLTHIQKEDILVLKSIWPSNQVDDYRYIFEDVMDEVVNMLKLGSKWTYVDVFTGLIEYFMKVVKKRRFMIHQWDRLASSLPLDIKGYKKEQPEEIALEVLLKIMLRKSNNHTT